MLSCRDREPSRSPLKKLIDYQVFKLKKSASHPHDRGKKGKFKASPECMYAAFASIFREHRIWSKQRTSLLAFLFNSDLKAIPPAAEASNENISFIRAM